MDMDLQQTAQGPSSAAGSETHSITHTTLRIVCLRRRQATYCRYEARPLFYVHPTIGPGPRGPLGRADRRIGAE
jgi:hypothetical protein